MNSDKGGVLYFFFEQPLEKIVFVALPYLST